MTCKIALLILIFIIIMFLSVNKKFIGGNFFKDLQTNNFINRKTICSDDANIMKLSYNKKICIFIDIYNNYTTDKVLDYLKKTYTNTHNNIHDNINNLYCKLYMPLHIVINNKIYQEKILNNLGDLLMLINPNFIIIDYFRLHKIYMTDKEKWYNIYKKHKIIYKKYSKKSYDFSIKNFLIATINPIHSTIYNKLFYFINKKVYNDNEIINKINDETEKERIKNKSFSEFYKINTNIINDKLLFSDFYKIDNPNTDFDYGPIIKNLIETVYYISKNDSTKIQEFSNDLLILKKILNNYNYNLLFENFKKELLNNLYVYNNLCNNPYFTNNMLSCPSKISVNLENGNKTYNCNDIINDIPFDNISPNKDKCNECLYSIKDCKVNLKCKSNNINDISFLNIDPSKKHTNITQNKCIVNTSIVNIKKNNFENEIRNKQISNYNKKLILSKPMCTKSPVRYYKRYVPINHICTYLKNNNIYNYLYIPKHNIDTIITKNTNLNTDKKSVGYISINKKTTSGIKSSIIHYLFKENKELDTIPLNVKNHLSSGNKAIIDTMEQVDHTLIYNDLKQIIINIGKKGTGGKYENSINICPTKGGDTIISFELKGDRNFRWYDTKIKAYGGNVNNNNNMRSLQTGVIKMYSQNNKGSLHKFYKKNNICAGSGGGTINQLKNEFKFTLNNEVVETPNSFNKKELFSINSKKYYLYQKKNLSKSYGITSNKNEIISYPSGGNGGSLNTLNGFSSESFGCGGGSGSKKIYESKDNIFGNGGDGKKGAVIIMNEKGDILFNSTENILNNKFTININTKTASSTYPSSTDSNIIRLYKNEFFYIISIGGGGGGEISGYSGNAGNMIISRHCNFDIDNSSIIEPVHQMHKDTLKSAEDTFTRNLKNIIFNSINNIYTGFNYNYEDTRNNFINIDKDTQIIDQTTYDTQRNIACLYNKCLSKINILRDTNLEHVLYSINDNIEHKFKTVQFKKSTTDFVSKIQFKEPESEEDNISSYYINNYIIFYKTNSLNGTMFKTNKKLQKKYFSNNSNLYFLYHTINEKDHFYFITKNLTKNTTKSLWIHNDLIQITKITKNSFTCITNIKPTGQDIICSVKLSNTKIDQIYNITTLEKVIPNKKCYTTKDVQDYCPTNMRYSEMRSHDTCKTPECKKEIDNVTCCKIKPAQCMSVEKTARGSFCTTNPKSIKKRWSNTNNNTECTTQICNTHDDIGKCCEIIPDKCNTISNKTQFYKDYTHMEYDKTKAQVECSVKKHTKECSQVDDLTSCSKPKLKEKCSTVATQSCAHGTGDNLNKIYDSSKSDVECGDGSLQQNDWKCDLTKDKHRENCCKYKIPKCSDPKEKGGPNINTIGSSSDVQKNRNEWCGTNMIWDDTKTDSDLTKYYTINPSSGDKKEMINSCCRPKECKDEPLPLNMVRTTHIKVDGLTNANCFTNIDKCSDFKSCPDKFSIDLNSHNEYQKIAANGNFDLNATIKTCCVPSTIWEIKLDTATLHYLPGDNIVSGIFDRAENAGNLTRIKPGTYTFNFSDATEKVLYKALGDFSPFVLPGGHRFGGLAQSRLKRRFKKDKYYIYSHSGPNWATIYEVWEKTTNSKPTITQFSPSGSAIPTDTNIVLTFDRNIYGISNKNLNIWWGGVVKSQISMGNGQITISGNTLTVNPSSDLPANTNITISIDVGALGVVGVANPLSDAVSANTYNFTTGDPPSAQPLTLTSWTSGTVYSPYSASMTFNQAIKLNTFSAGAVFFGVNNNMKYNLRGFRQGAQNHSGKLTYDKFQKGTTVTISGDTITVTPSPITAGEHTFKMDAGFIATKTSGKTNIETNIEYTFTVTFALPNFTPPLIPILNPIPTPIEHNSNPRDNPILTEFHPNFTPPPLSPPVQRQFTPFQRQFPPSVGFSELPLQAWASNYGGGGLKSLDDLKSLDEMKNQIVICLKTDHVKDNKDGTYTYEGVMYTHDKINTLDDQTIKDFSSIKMKGRDTKQYMLSDICRYFNTTDKLEITNLYDCNQNNHYKVNDDISINYNLIYIIPISRLLSDYDLYNIDNTLIREKYIELTNKYNKSSSYEFYFVFNTTISNVFNINTKYVLRSNKTSSLQNIKCIGNVDIYDIILINKSNKKTFEMDNVYRVSAFKNKICKTSNDLFNTKKDESGESICCNIPVLDNEINIKNNCIDNILESSLCWHNEPKCNLNYFKILEESNDEFYFNIDNIPKIGTSPIKLKVDIFRNNIIIKNNIIVQIKKDESKSYINYIKYIKNKEYWILGNPDIIENVVKSQYPLTDIDLKLFSNNITITQSSEMSPVLKTVSSLLYSTTTPITLTNDTFTFKIKFKHAVTVTNIKIYASLNSSDTPKDIIFNHNNEIETLHVVNSVDNDWEVNKSNYMISLRIDPTAYEKQTEVTIEIIVPENVSFYLYNLSLKGKQTSFPLGFGKGQIKLLESTLKLKKNDTIVLKKNI